jgi:hypothetical protein
MTSRRKSFGKRTPRPPDGLFGANGSWVHGCYRTPEYRSYVNAKTRCMNPKNPQYCGSRGIEFRLPPFAMFIELLGRARGRVLDRRDRGSHFEIGNVYWRRRRKKRPTPKAKTRIAVEKTPRVKPVNVCGHLDRPHYAFGLCVVCYRISPEGRAVRRRYETSLKGKKTRALRRRLQSSTPAGGINDTGSMSVKAVNNK